MLAASCFCFLFQFASVCVAFSVQASAPAPQPSWVWWDWSFLLAPDAGRKYWHILRNCGWCPELHSFNPHLPSGSRNRKSAPASCLFSERGSAPAGSHTCKVSPSTPQLTSWHLQSSPPPKGSHWLSYFCQQLSLPLHPWSPLAVAFCQNKGHCLLASLKIRLPYTDAWTWVLSETGAQKLPRLKYPSHIQACLARPIFLPPFLLLTIG